MKPTYSKNSKEWNYTPILVEIYPLDVTGFDLYTTKDLKNNSRLKIEDNILVWNGGGLKVSYKSYKEDGDTYYYATKVTVPGLYVQKVYTLPGGKIATKKLSLRAGGWTRKTITYREDGEKYTESWFIPSGGKFDYYFEEEDVDGYEKGNYIQPILNDETIYDEDTGKLLVKAGYFTGTLPNFNVVEY